MKKVHRRLTSTLGGIVLLSVLMLCLTAVVAEGKEAFPNRTIEFIVPWGVGGGYDTTVRKLLSLSEEYLGVKTVSTNVPGASGQLGKAQTFSRPADGYTLTSSEVEALTGEILGTYRFKRNQWEHIFRMVTAFGGYYIRPDGIKKDGKVLNTWDEIMAYAKANPGKISVCGSGFGSCDHISTAAWATLGINFKYLPMDVPAERYSAVQGGDVDMIWDQLGDEEAFIRAGKIKPVLWMAQNKVPGYEEIPLAKKYGYDFDFVFFRGIAVKEGTPPERVKFLSDSFLKATKTKGWADFEKDQWLNIADRPLGYEEYSSWVEKYYTDLKKVITETGIDKQMTGKKK